MLRALLASTIVALAFAGSVLAAGGNYTIDGGTSYEQSLVKKGLDASSFNWSVVPAVRIHIVPSTAATCGYEPLGSLIAAGCATPGEIWLQADGWGDPIIGASALMDIVQHEYAHEVDLLLLTDAQRTEATALLGGNAWWLQPGAAHEQATSERFASMVAWTFGAQSQGPRYNRDTREAVTHGAAPRALQTMLARWGLAATPAPVCRKVMTARGRWTWVRVNGKRVHRWIRPTYKTVCS